MKIGINARLLLPDRLEGIGWFIYETVRRMAAEHPEDEFILFFDRAFDARFIFASNVHGVTLFPQARHPLLFRWWFEWSLPSAMRRHKIDVFYSADGFCSLSSRVPTLLVLHDLAYRHFPEGISTANLAYYQKFIPQFLVRADKIVTVSAFSKNDILKSFNLKNTDITVCYNGCRPKFVPQQSLCKAKTRDWVFSDRVSRQFIDDGWLIPYYTEGGYFLYVGSVHPRKNVARLIEAFDMFKKNILPQSTAKYRLVIAGRMAWKNQEITDLLKRISHKSDILFLDYVADSDLPRLVGSALALVYPSLFEGFGVPLLEAMQCEVPIITSNVSSMPEVAGKAALLVNPQDVAEIAEAMQQVAEDETLREQLIEAGRQQKQLFSWDKSSKQIYFELKKLYEKKLTD
jgi:glycosyltransferase involved in cell wall biosynthesis